MKKVLLHGLLFFGITFFQINGTDRDRWKHVVTDVCDALSSMSDELSFDIKSFDQLYRELGNLADLVRERDVADEIFYVGLQNRLEGAQKAYEDCLAFERELNAKSNYDLQQLKVTLAATQAVTQQQIDQLKDAYSEAQIQLQQLIDCYNQFVKDDSDKVDALVNLLRSICDQYSIMIQHKQAAFDEINDLISSLNAHVTASENRISSIS